MLNQKKISRAGSVTIPAHLRRKYGITAGEQVAIEMDAAGMISMKRIVGRCVFCGADKELRMYKGRFVCAACAAALGKEDGHV